jgi:hypothetical protein
VVEQLFSIPRQATAAVPMEQLSAEERARIEARQELPRFVGGHCRNGEEFCGIAEDSSSLTPQEKEKYIEDHRLHLQHGDKVAKTDDGYLVIHPIPDPGYR